MNLEEMIAELVDYDISYYKKLPVEDKIEFVSGLLEDKIRLLPEQEIRSFYDTLKGK